MTKEKELEFRSDFSTCWLSFQPINFCCPNFPSFLLGVSRSLLYADYISQIQIHLSLTTSFSGIKKLLESSPNWYPRIAFTQATPRWHKARTDAPHLPFPVHDCVEAWGVNRDHCQCSNLQQCNPSPWIRRSSNSWYQLFPKCFHWQVCFWA